MDREEYRAAALALSKRPPSLEHPTGQKFRIGETVRITNPQSWFAKRRIGQLFIVAYSYWQKFPSAGNKDKDRRTYALISTIDGDTTSWYEEGELEAVAHGKVSEVPDREIAVIPKGTVIHFNGEPCRLVQNTAVVNASMAQAGFEEYCRMTRLLIYGNEINPS